MPYDKEYDEESWEYLKRKCPGIHRALNSIDYFHQARKSLFDGTFYWGDSKKARITERVIDGCLQLEIEDLTNRILEIHNWKDEVEEKHRIVKEKEKKWHLFAKEKDKAVFENGTGDLERVPQDLLEIIDEGKSFDGQIQSEGEFAKFVRNGETICRVSKSLVDQLREGEPCPGGGG